LLDEPRAKEFALAQIDKMSDASATGKERTERKRRLTRGPTEFRQGRLDQPRKGRFRKTDAPPAPVFVLEIDGQPILAFKAATFRQARELGKEDWLQEDLKRMTIGHRPLWDGKSPIRVRRAEPAEEAYYVDAKAENAVGDLPLVYLVQRDHEADTSGPVTRGSFPPGR
jgi:hypothetical protein